MRFRNRAQQYAGSPGIAYLILVPASRHTAVFASPPHRSEYISAKQFVAI